MPIPRGGGARLVDALVRLIEDNGGTCRTGADVEQRRRRRTAVRPGCARPSGEVVAARRAVVCNVTPTQLYGRLLELETCPRTSPRPAGASASAARRCRSTTRCPSRRAGTGDERLARTAIVHVTPGLDGVSRAVNEAERGLLPAEATVVVGQPLTMDESRAPQGAGLLWIQLQELPWHVKGDAAGEHRRRRRDVDASRCASATPTASRRGSHDTSRISSRHPQARRAVARRPAGGEHQPRARRSVLRLARARPELPLASVRAAARTSHTRARALSHRCEHVARAGGLGRRELSRQLSFRA